MVMMTYSTSQTALRNKVFCLIGPSGTGKDSIAELFSLPKVVSYRTRPMRDGEVDGKNGHFISVAEFLQLKEQDLLIAETFYAGHYYGITQGELMELEEKPMLYVVDWVGAELLRKGIEKIQGYSAEQVVTIFIHTNRNDLETRMKRRGTDKEVIRARLDRADIDYASSSQCDYVVHNRNGEIEKTAFQISQIILKQMFSHQVEITS